ncbi:hypothetical protein LIPSTDRAFT_69628 [Lipomyces starkeyi NRRL Y-11557]|uniref:Uncharacterized protein n=1 Tax=Lipomyces starkeyi NRRL Y-11557 TaxID=675824 RepID=A0A1E3Q8Q1_LIPST|nr:hypothetical protein LIPSTDRAFT_69628 [Lipomyces starkeyi NRRL Y-11557]
MLGILLVPSDPYIVSFRRTDVVLTPSDGPLLPDPNDIWPISPEGVILLISVRIRRLPIRTG